MATIAELAESEGVFTTAQAARMGVCRDALHDAVVSGRLERIMRGAYRLVGSGATWTDELAAIWKLTAPAKFTHERMQATMWDGIAVGGSSAAAVLDIGDLHLNPYRIYTPKRFNSRNKAASFATRRIDRDEVTFKNSLPVTLPERTVFDLVADDEDLSLVADVLRDACKGNERFDFKKLETLLVTEFGESTGRRTLETLRNELGALGKEQTHGIHISCGA